MFFNLFYKKKTLTTQPDPKPGRWQTLFFLIALIFVPFFAFLKQSVAEWYFDTTACEEPRRRQWTQFGVPVPTDYGILGIDVSHYQCRINWADVAKMGAGSSKKIRFAFMRAIGKGGLVDFQFRNNWKNAKKVGILRGAYHFLYLSDDPVVQARLFLSQVNIEKGDLPPVLDVEDDLSGLEKDFDKEKVVFYIQTWLDIVEKETGVKPIIYTNQDYYKRYIAYNFSAYKIWIAAYKTPQMGPLLDGRRWSFWQFSESARCNGVSEKLDLNVFAGTEAELRALCKP